MATRKRRPPRTFNPAGLLAPSPFEQMRSEHFRPTDFEHSAPASTCLYCGDPFAKAKAYVSGRSKGMTIFCPHCGARVFLPSAVSALGSEAMRRILTEPETADTMRAILYAKMEEIRAEKGV